MKKRTLIASPSLPSIAVLGLASALTALPVMAGQPLTEASGKSAKTVEVTPDYQLQPIFTRLAKIVDKVTVNTTLRGSRNVDLQEAANLDSWGADIDLTIPLHERFQIRLNVPIYTNGYAELLPVQVTGKGGVIETQKTGHISMSGNGGVFDFASVQIEGQILDEARHGVNLTASVGWGTVLDPLTTSTAGRYNHDGECFLFQLRADKKVNDWLTVVGHLGMRRYYISDDINPAGQRDGNDFNHYEAFVAGVFNPWNSNIFPVLEVAFTGDLDHYNSVLVVPEVIWAVNSSLEVKLGLPVGVSTDGERVGFRLQATARF